MDRWRRLRTDGCSDHPPFDERVYGMLVIWEIESADADRLQLPDTEAVALAGEWTLEAMRPYFSLYRNARIAGENSARDYVYRAFALSHADFRREIRVRLLVALELTFFVPTVGLAYNFLPKSTRALSLENRLRARLLRR